MEMDAVAEQDRNAVSIVSDGTEEGTVVYIGGQKVAGLVSVRWELKPSTNKARVVLEIDGAHLDAQQVESAEIRRAVASVQQRQPT